MILVDEVFEAFDEGGGVGGFDDGIEQIIVFRDFRRSGLTRTLRREEVLTSVFGLSQSGCDIGVKSFCIGGVGDGVGGGEWVGSIFMIIGSSDVDFVRLPAGRTFISEPFWCLSYGRSNLKDK